MEFYDNIKIYKHIYAYGYFCVNIMLNVPIER